ncbi:MAG: response regulator transcription factor [Bacteroidales bacterium]|nr:response regulator transcription factor [Bacteroidales bacterium]
MSNSYRILAVDDEEDLCEILKFNLELEGYIVDVAYSAEEALKKDLSQYNLLLLDVMMGNISGYQMAKIIRNNPALSKIPIVFLTAKDTENDMLHGFNIGADDYISKPYSIREVSARVKALLRRSNETTPEENGIISYHSLKIDTKKKKAAINDEELQLTKKEFEILKLLLSNIGCVFSREEILSKIWSDEVYVLDRTVDVNITRLRKKLGDYGKNVTTRLGYGYCFEQV